MNASQHRFALLTFAGLGDLAAREAGTRGDIEHLRNQDLVLCPPDASTRGLAALRTVEDVFLMLGGPISLRANADLRGIERRLTAPVLLDALQVKNRLFAPPKPRHVTFNAFVKQDRDHAIHRRRIETAMTRAIGEAFPRWKLADPAAVEVWAFYVDDKVRLGFRLSGEAMRYHGAAPALRKGALRPTIAGAMVTVAEPRPGEVVIDPMCGSGSILHETAAASRGTVIVAGGDIDSSGLIEARRGGMRIAHWDARRLPLASASVDCIVSNLPFGRQYKAEGSLGQLYTRAMADWARVLKPGGRMSLLTSETALLSRAVKAAGLTIEATHRVKVLGVWATIRRIGGPRNA